MSDTIDNEAREIMNNLIDLCLSPRFNKPWTPPNDEDKLYFAQLIEEERLDEEQELEDAELGRNIRKLLQVWHPITISGPTEGGYAMVKVRERNSLDSVEEIIFEGETIYMAIDQAMNYISKYNEDNNAEV